MRHDLGDHLTANHLEKVVASELGRGHILGGSRSVEFENIFLQYSHVHSIVGPIALEFDVAIYPTIVPSYLVPWHVW